MGNNEDRVKNAYKKYTCMIKLWTCLAGSSNFTLEKYKKLKNCTISSVDYSSEMLAISKRKFEKENLMQIKLYEESVYALPFKDGHFDYILTMNGFPVFTEKKAAFEELYRVLQKGGIVSGCFYIQDQRYLTDLIIKTCFVHSSYLAHLFIQLKKSHCF